VNELYQPSDRRLSAKLVPAFANRWCHVVSVTDPYGRILGFVDRHSITGRFLIQVAKLVNKNTGVSPQNAVEGPNVFLALSQLSSTFGLRLLRHCAPPRWKPGWFWALDNVYWRKELRPGDLLGNVMDVGWEEARVGGKRLVRNTVGSRQAVALPSIFATRKNGCPIEE
jgi:hypothetical protein